MNDKQLKYEKSQKELVLKLRLMFVKMRNEPKPDFLIIHESLVSGIDQSPKNWWKNDVKLND